MTPARFPRVRELLRYAANSHALGHSVTARDQALVALLELARAMDLSEDAVSAIEETVDRDDSYEMARRSGRVVTLRPGAGP